MKTSRLLITIFAFFALHSNLMGQEETARALQADSSFSYPKLYVDGAEFVHAEVVRDEDAAWVDTELIPVALGGDKDLVQDIKTEKICPVSCRCQKCRRCVYGFADALFMSRNVNLDNQLLAFNTGTGAPALTTGNLRFSSGTGFRAMAGIELSKCKCTALEIEYLGLNDIFAGAGAAGANNLAIPGALGLAALDFFNADQFTATYASNLNSAEINYVRSCRDDRCWIRSCFAGLRYLSLDEEFNLKPGDPNTGSSNYNIKTDNNLYGVQFGGRLRRQRRIIGFNATAKAGVFFNDARQQQFVTDFPPPGFFLRPLRSADEETLAIVGELSLITTVRLNRIWSVRAGYNFIWIDGVALGISQLDFSNLPTSGTAINPTGSLFLHGASVGLSARF